MSTQFPLIAGKHAGKRIRVVPAVKPAYDQLEKAAQSGQHWARLTVKGLNALSSGTLDKDNIFVQSNQRVQGSTESFHVVLPGCKATVERRQNDDYVLVNLVLDSTYFDMQGKNEATGLYRARKVGRGIWKTDSLDKGDIDQGDKKPSGNDIRIAAITDAGYDHADNAAEEIAPLLAKVPGATSSSFKLFDLHYTAGEGKFGGMKNFKKAVRNPLSIEASQGSAILLAETMYKSRKIDDISWVSVLGGSSVLTQAMRILADKGVKLDNQTVYLYRPQTSPDAALKEAQRLGLNLERDFMASTPLDYIANRDRFKITTGRFKSESSYTVGNAVWDISKSVASAKGGVTSIAGLAGAAGLAIAGPSMPALFTVGAAILTGAKLADKTVEHFAPHTYHKHIGKIK